MPSPFTISFRSLPSSPVIEEIAFARFAALSRYHPAIIEGRLVVEEDERRHQHGRRVHARLTIAVPGEDIVIDHKPSSAGLRRQAIASPKKQDEHDGDLTDASLAVRRAFDAARRRLQDHARQMRGQVKRRRAV